MDSYIPQLPPLRLPQQISQLLNQLSTTTDSESDYEEEEEEQSVKNDGKQNQDSELQKSLPEQPFLNITKPILDDDDDDDDDDDEIELIGRFILPAHTSANKRSKNGTYEEKSGATRRGGSATNSANENSSSKWLIQKYFQQFNDSWNARMRDGGEPQGIVAAPEPSVCPPIQPVGLVESSAMDTELESGSMTFNSDNAGSSSSAGSPPSSSSVAAYAAAASHSSKKKKLSPSKLVLDESDLRHRIKEIKELSLSDRERDKRVQRLMTERYYYITKLSSPDDLYEEEENDEEEEEEEEGLIENDSETHHLDHSHHDHHREPVSIRTPTSTVADLKPTYFSKQEDILGCQHYQRGCKLECSTCYKWYTCRLCHDEVESHKLIRPETAHMLCMYCGLVQTVGQDCAGCHMQLARYYCKECKLWDDDNTKSIYHCADCGLCRIGEGLGKDFFHCKTCNVCMSIDLKDSHRCIEHSTECDCPICGEYMFTSTETVVFMSCGHSIHQGCFRQHTKTSYKCPTCSRSVINMAAQFRILDRDIEQQPMPDPYSKWSAVVVCNDCLAKSEVKFHFLGLKCTNCGSYNTAQHKIIKPHRKRSSASTTLLTHGPEVIPRVEESLIIEEELTGDADFTGLTYTDTEDL